jgi:hypothetical protein
VVASLGRLDELKTEEEEGLTSHTGEQNGKQRAERK